VYLSSLVFTLRKCEIDLHEIGLEIYTKIVERILFSSSRVQYNLHLKLFPLKNLVNTKMLYGL
jgi:hypothetical protein